MSDLTFAPRAEEFLVTHLRTSGRTSGEDLVTRCKEAGIAPHDDRAFGPVFKRLMRAGKIRKAGVGPRTKGNSSAGTYWEAGRLPATVTPA